MLPQKILNFQTLVGTFTFSRIVKTILKASLLYSIRIKYSCWATSGQVVSSSQAGRSTRYPAINKTPEPILDCLV